MGSDSETIFRAPYTLIDGQFESDVAVVVRQGKIRKILRASEMAERVGSGSRVVEWDDAALIPGQINVHSHAFQRSLRGKTEYRRESKISDDFWSWRTGMYRLANRIDLKEMEIIARMAFLEMLRSGITHVGEFHYLHHRRNGKPYDEPAEMALCIGRAAEDVGLRLTMLPVAYHTGDIGKPAQPEQRRFVHDDVETYLEMVERLSANWQEHQTLTMGVAPHSIRAVSKRWLESISTWAGKRGMPVHIHVSEQPQEVRRSQECYGMTPVEALYQWGVLDESWTLIHGTHLTKRELEILEEVRPTIGACPTTERNLGDGFLPARELVERQVPVALGSDSHTVIDHFEEMRLVEYHERLRHQERNVLSGADPQGRTETAAILWPMGTSHGARSLKSDGGSIREGAAADLVAIDLAHPSIAGATAATLLSDVVLSMSAAAVRDVIVAGEMVVADRRHINEDEIVDNYRVLMNEYADNP